MNYCNLRNLKPNRIGCGVYPYIIIRHPNIKNVGNLNISDTPQIILITFDDAINPINIELYEELFNNVSHKNPNGCPWRATFYISHEWTDYSMVQDLYSVGHEMASHTVS